MSKAFRGLYLGALSLALASCAWFESSTPTVKAPEPVQPVRDAILEIRAAAAKTGDVLTIVPVQNPAVTLIFEKIEAADRAGDHFKARELTVEARIIEPENPLVLQYAAEGLYRNENYLEAEMMARKSFEQSAQLGPLCVRNWLLIAEVKRAQRQLTEEDEARAQAEKCPVKPLQRL